MIKYGIPILTILLIAAFLPACSQNSNEPQQTESAPQVTTISAEQLNQQLASKDFTLINVHIPYAGEIPKTDTFIPFNDIAGNLATLPEDKSSKIVVYCRSGGMSASASRDLLDLGFTNVYDLQGGMNSWQNAGFELLNKQH